MSWLEFDILGGLVRWSNFISLDYRIIFGLAESEILGSRIKVTTFFQCAWVCSGAPTFSVCLLVLVPILLPVISQLAVLSADQNITKGKRNLGLKGAATTFIATACCERRRRHRHHQYCHAIAFRWTFAKNDSLHRIVLCEELNLEVWWCQTQVNFNWSSYHFKRPSSYGATHHGLSEANPSLVLCWGFSSRPSLLAPSLCFYRYAEDW